LEERTLPSDRVSKAVETCAGADAPFDGAQDRLRDGRSEV
jgi:hypothetical protein